MRGGPTTRAGWWRAYSDAAGDPNRDSNRDASGDCDRGMVTAELAVAMPAVVMVLAVSLFAFTLASDELRCIDAARAAARAAARGDPSSEVLSVARRMAPAGSQVSIGIGSNTVSVRVAAPPRFSSVLIESAHPAATATAARETGDAP